MAGKKTGGRVAGTPNKRKRQAVVAEAIARVGETIPDAFAGDAHALLIATYKNPNLDLHVRLDAAKAALPYEKPRRRNTDREAWGSATRSAAPASAATSQIASHCGSSKVHKQNQSRRSGQGKRSKCRSDGLCSAGVMAFGKQSEGVE